MINGGIRAARKQREWKPVNALLCDDVLSCDRSQWRRVLTNHWHGRFHDDLDDASTYVPFHMELCSRASTRRHLGFGEYALALSGAKSGTAGGPDELNNEMLLAAPWSFHCVLHALFYYGLMMLTTLPP